MLSKPQSQQLSPVHKGSVMPYQIGMYSQSISKHTNIGKSPYKYLLQNNVKFNVSKQIERTKQQIEIIKRLIEQNTLFTDLGIDLSNQAIAKEVCNGIIIMYSESPHIVDIKDNEIYMFLQGQGFEYMQNKYNDSVAKRYKIYQNNEYVMVRKLSTNQYFISLPENTAKYQLLPNLKKYQLMADEQTLLGKISEELFIKLFLPKIQEKQKLQIQFLKRVQIFEGLPNNFYLEFSKFLIDMSVCANSRVISKQQKNKFVYFVKSGKVQFRHYNDLGRSKTPGNVSSNYYVSVTKPYLVEIFNQYEAFGMDTRSEDNQGQDSEAICLTDCSFYKIDKRLLAIVITSFEIEFQRRNKVWSEVNINNQIKGQSYISPEKQLLVKNAERIKTSEKKIRDIKLRYLSSKKVKHLDDKIDTEDIKHKKQEEIHQNHNNITASQPQFRRKHAKTSDGRFRSTSTINFHHQVSALGFFLQQSKYQNVRKQLQLKADYQPTHANFELRPYEDQHIDRHSPLLRSNHLLEYKNKLQETQRSAFYSTRAKQQSYVNSHKLIPKVAPKIFKNESSGKVQTDIINVFLDKKIKNEIIKKAQKIMKLQKSSKIFQSKNLKRLFANSKERNINTISQFDKKNIADEIFEKMSNLNQNPLLFHIQNQRKLIEKQMIIAQRQAKKLQREDQKRNKKIKKEDENIVIKNHQQ